MVPFIMGHLEKIELCKEDHSDVNNSRTRAAGEKKWLQKAEDTHKLKPISFHKWEVVFYVQKQ